MTPPKLAAAPSETGCKWCDAGLPIKYDATGHLHLTIDDYPWARFYEQCTRDKWPALAAIDAAKEQGA